MAITLIIEDGSNVTDSNTYEGVAFLRACALDRGVTLSADDEILGAMIIKAIDYIEAKGCYYQGEPTNIGQSLSWPRTGAIVNCQEVAVDSIPKQLKGLLCQLVLAVNEGVDLFPNVSFQDFVTEEKIGPITTKYSDPSKMSLSPRMSAAEALLLQLSKTCSQSAVGLRTVRV